MARTRPDWRFHLYVPRGIDVPGGVPANLLVRTLPLPAGSPIARFGGERLLLPWIARQDRLRIVHSLNGSGPLRGSFRRVVTLHDLVFEHFPADYPSWQRFFVHHMFRTSAEGAHAVVTVSEHARRDILRTYRLPADRVVATPNGPGRSPVRASEAVRARVRRELSLEGPVVLAVSTAHHYKNLDGLVRAAAVLRHRHPEVTFVATGSLLGLEGELRALADELDVPIRWTGWVDDATLEAVFAEATVFAYPSLAEGFGLPLLEAFARDVPVVSSGAGPLPEVGGDGALYVDAEDPEAFAGALERVLFDPALRGRLVQAGRLQLGRFSWDRTAKQTVAVYDSLLGSVPTRRHDEGVTGATVQSDDDH